MVFPGNGFFLLCAHQPLAGVGRSATFLPTVNHQLPGGRLARRVAAPVAASTLAPNSWVARQSPCLCLCSGLAPVALGLPPRVSAGVSARGGASIKEQGDLCKQGLPTDSRLRRLPVAPGLPSGVQGPPTLLGPIRARAGIPYRSQKALGPLFPQSRRRPPCHPAVLLPTRAPQCFHQLRA